jgi:signal peptide peptidase SppA
MHLPHLASRLYGTPLLVARSKLDIILAVLGDRIGWPEPQAALPIPPPRVLPNAPAGIAVIPIYGTLVRRSVGLEAASGLTSYAELSAMLDAALSDSQVEGILLDVDSPGGEAGGVFELAQRIRAADAIKPVWAIASDSAFSAAYAIACAASRVYVTQTGGVGSIGVIAMHVDQTARDAEEGYRYTAITAGDQKNDFSPHEKLSTEAHARLQAEVDRLYGMFVDTVATMRKLESRFVRSTQAGLYFGPEAIKAGLADAQGNLEQTLQDFTTHLVANRARNPTTRTFSAANPKEIHMTQEVESRPATSQDATQLVPAPTDNKTQDVTETISDDLTEAPAVTDEVVQAAAASAHANAVAIAELCQLAGQPQRIAAFLASGTSETQVRSTLLSARADSVEISSVLHPDAAAAPASPEQNPLMKAVKKLTHKE